MLTEDEARGLVLRELARRTTEKSMDLAVSKVEEVSFGWVFHWCAKQDIGRPKGLRPTFGGNRPYLVDRENGQLVVTTTAKPLPRQIADYERRLRREAHARNAAAKRAGQQPRPL